MIDQPDKLVILDLDETLVHATEKDLGIQEDFIFDKYYVHKRPFLEKFLVNISKYFKIGIWSSADDVYVSEIVKAISPQNVDLEVVWGRSRCSLKRDFETDTHYFEKRLSKLKKRGFRLGQILIVDDTPQKAKSNYGNAVYIKEYLGDPSDDELKHLDAYLLSLKDVENLRAIEKRGWRKSIGGT